jgi:hypothetical protein
VPTLSEYSNVYASALGIISEKGYQIWFDKNANLFYAERDGWDFASESPCGLLGLIAMYEHVSPTGYDEYWWRREGIDTREVPGEPVAFRSVLVRRPAQ